jgi:hypothetical protein
VAKNFCEHQLELSEYARNALRDLIKNEWVSPGGNELPVPGASEKQLDYIHEWMTLVLRVGQWRWRRQQPQERLILDETTTWTETGTGLPGTLLEWADKCHSDLTVNEYFLLMDAADFMIIDDMLELLAHRLSWEMIQGRKEVMAEADKTKLCPLEYLTVKRKLAFVQEWLGSDSVVAVADAAAAAPSHSLHPTKSFFNDIRANFRKFNRLRNRIMSCQRMSPMYPLNGLDFKEDAVALYLILLEL